MKQFIVLPFVALMLVACNQTEAEPAAEQSSSMSDTMQASSVSEMTKEETLTFVGKSTLIDHDGGFENYTVATTLAHTQPFTDAQIDITIDTTSIYSDNEGLTGHLNAEDFFDTANYPEAMFSSTSIIETPGTNQYLITGDLTIKGITAEVESTAEVEDGYVTVWAEVPRKTFNVGNDAYGEKLLAEMIPVTLVYQLEQ